MVAAGADSLHRTGRALTWRHGHHTRRRFTDPTFCNLTADGSSATAGNGTVRFRYVNATGRLQVIRAHGNLHIYQVQGCGGAFHDGDTAALSGSYMTTPVQTITSP